MERLDCTDENLMRPVGRLYDTYDVYQVENEYYILIDMERVKGIGCFLVRICGVDVPYIRYHEAEATKV